MATTNVSASPKSKTVTLLLCCLGFFGLGGMHRFYVGKVGTGLIYLCTVGLVWVGTILDLLKILSGTFTDGAGEPIRN